MPVGRPSPPSAAEPPLTVPWSALFSLSPTQVIYNKPVYVTGTPRLSFVLDSTDDSVSSDSYAYYDSSFDIGRYRLLFTVPCIDFCSKPEEGTLTLCLDTKKNVESKQKLSLSYF